MEILTTHYFDRWFRKLNDQTARARILLRIRRLSLGNLGDVKPVGNSISEIRIDYGPGYRIYFTKRNKEIILLLIGGDKSSQAKDIEKAQKIASETGTTHDD